MMRHPDVPPSDADLAAVVAARSADDPAAGRAARAACDQLYRRHAGKLLAFLSARCPRADLDDVHQEVWVRVWRTAPAGWRGGNFRAWLFQIARTVVIDFARKRRPAELGEADPADDRPDAAAALLAAERAAALERCLQKLDAESADLVRARLANESYGAICDRTGMKPERAYKLYLQAKASLQSCVERALS
jgi:RNA polymerase sigma-70 factor (ECF subfamily)